MLSYSHSTGHHMTLCHCHSHNPTLIATIDTLSKSDSIQNLKITDLHGHLLFDSSMDPALLSGVDDADDQDTSFAGVHDEDILCRSACTQHHHHDKHRQQLRCRI